MIARVVRQEINAGMRDRARGKAVDLTAVKTRLMNAACIFEQVVTGRQFVDFITSYLYGLPSFNIEHNTFHIASAL